MAIIFLDLYWLAPSILGEFGPRFGYTGANGAATIPLQRIVADSKYHAGVNTYYFTSSDVVFAFSVLHH